MRMLPALVGAAVLGALVTWIWMDGHAGDARPGPGPVSQPAPAADDEQPREPAPAQPDPSPPSARPGLEGRAVPEPVVEISEGGGVGVTSRGPVDAARMVQAVQRAFSDKLDEKDARIRELEEQVGRLQATMPKPEILERLESASIGDYELLLREIKTIATKRLLSVPEQVGRRHATFLEGEGTGAARILPRGRFEDILEPRGGGAYWSFKTKSNSYDKEPDLQLEHGIYSTSFYGGTEGWLLDLGDVAIEDVDADQNRPPPGLAGKPLEGWTWLWQTSEPESERRPDRRTMPGTNPGLTDRAKSVPGHSYLLRAILPGEHDILVVFRAVEEDENGQSLVYRILKEFEMPRRR